MTVELHDSDRLPSPQGYSHLSIGPANGRVVHLAGQIGTDGDGNHADGLAGQTTQALHNLIDALAAVDGDATDLAKLTIYIVGWDASMQDAFLNGMMAAAERTPLPLVPITLVGVQSLFLDESLVEIEGVAVLAG